MDINHLISQYGYAALIVGSMAEGETITLLGGVAAHFPAAEYCRSAGVGPAVYHHWLSRRRGGWPVAAPSGCPSEALDLADPRGGGGGGRPLVAQAARE